MVWAAGLQPIYRKQLSPVGREITQARVASVGEMSRGGYSYLDEPQKSLRASLSGLSCSSIFPSFPRMTAIAQ